MRRSPLIFLLVALLLGVLVAGVFYYRHRHSPRYALHQMALSLTNRNYDNFYDYVDLAGIVSHLMEETGKALLAPNLPGGNFLSQFAFKMGGRVVRHLFESFEREFRKLANQYFDTLTTQELLALQGAVALADISQKGEEAQVTLRFPEKDTRLRLTMAWNSQQRRWRVVSVNYEDLKALLNRELW